MQAARREQAKYNAASSWRSSLSSSGSVPVVHGHKEKKEKQEGRPLPPHPSRQPEVPSVQQQAEQNGLEEYVWGRRECFTIVNK